MQPNIFNNDLFIAYILAKKGKRSYIQIAKEIDPEIKSTLHRIIKKKGYSTDLANICKICDWMQVSVRIFFNN